VKRLSTEPTYCLRLVYATHAAVYLKATVPRSSFSRLSPIAAANVTNDQAKPLILLHGGGRSRDRTGLSIPIPC
jgi:hypothetical protein